MTDCSDPSGNEHEVRHSFSFALFGDRRPESFFYFRFVTFLVPRPKSQLHGQLYLCKHRIFENPRKISRAFGRVQFKGNLKYEYIKSSVNLQMLEFLYDYLFQGEI